MKQSSLLGLLSALGILVDFTVCCRGANWYLDCNVSSPTSNGTSWATAWPSPTNVVWGPGGVDGGDTLYISGGTYTDPLYIKHSGSAGNLITIASSLDGGHSNMVVFEACGIYDNNQLRQYVKVTGEYNGTRNWLIENKTNGNAINFFSNDGNGKGCDFGWMTISNCATWPETGVGSWGALFYGSSTEALGLRVHDILFQRIRGDAIGLWTGKTGVPAGGNCRYENLEIYDAQDDGISANFNGVLVSNCFIHMLTNYISLGPHPDGLDTSLSGNCRVIDCRFAHIANDGIFFRMYGANNGNVEVINCVFDTMNVGVMMESTFAVPSTGLDTTMGTTNVVIANNSIAQTTFQSICLQDRDNFGTNWTIQALVANNVMTNSGTTAGITLTFATNNGVFVVNNLLCGDDNRTVEWWIRHAMHTFSYNLYSDVVAFQVSQPVVGNANTSNSMVFVNWSISPNTGIADFRPSAGSPSVNTGTNLNTIFTADIAGKIRGPVWDMGAYEYWRRTMEATHLRVNKIKSP